MTQIALFHDDATPTTPPLPKRIRDMHVMFGATPGETCGHCTHIHRFRQGATWYKCLKSDHEAGCVSTDWRVRWPACGLFEFRPAPNTP